VFIEIPPGRRHLQIENGAPHLWRRGSVDLMVDVPPEGQVMLRVKGELLQHMLPTVTPAPEFVGAVWLRPWTPKRVREVSSALAFVIAWSVLVAGALALTLRSLATDDFDGLNNMLQIPFALPWFLVVSRFAGSHSTDAWVVAAMGWANGLLIAAWMKWRSATSA
jgi:hypothetical protein